MTSETRDRRRHPSRSIARAVGFLAALGATGASTEAFAQTGPITQGGGFDLRLFRPAVDTKGQFTVNGPDVLGHLSPAFGIVVDYGRNLARIGAGGENGAHNRPLVENMFNGTLIANVGLFNYFVVGLQLPFHLLTGPRDSAGGTLDVAGYSPSSNGQVYQGVGDLAFNVKFRFLRTENRPYIGAAVIVQAGIPLGHESNAFAGDPGFSLWPQLAVEFRPNRGIFRANLNVGFRYFFGQGSTLPNDSGGIQYAPSLTAGLGFSIQPASALALVAEAYAVNYVNALGNVRAMPVEAIGGIKLFINRNSFLMLGAGSHIPIGEAYAAAELRAFVGILYEPSIGDSDGDGLNDDVDQCPSQPEDFDNFEDGDGCPELDNDQDGIPDVSDACPNQPEDRDGDHDDDGCPEGDEGDRDGDGILDRVDRCPDQPEDRDQFQDEDGCPDPDNDQDGILDTDDRCPNDPEDRDGFEDDDGCPDPDNDRDRILDTQDRCPDQPETYNGTDDTDGCPDTGEVVVEEGQIRILQAINFETGSARIRPDSMPIVEAVARTLIGNPQIELVEVQGHADERGRDETNVRLTHDRAASVVQALVERGVDRGRLHSAGYGARCRAGYPPVPGQPAMNAMCQHGGPRWCHSDRAWHLDRRVVFLILRTSDGPTNVRIACDEGAELIPEEDRQYHHP